MVSRASNGEGGSSQVDLFLSSLFVHLKFLSKRVFVATKHASWDMIDARRVVVSLLLVTSINDSSPGTEKG